MNLDFNDLALRTIQSQYGASRYLPVDNEDFFGFYGQNLNPMNQSPFFNTGDTDLFRLTDEAYRTLIFLKAAANIGTATLPSIKEILTALFDEPVLVMNIGEMKVRVVFEFFLTPYQRAIFETYGLFNLGAGVGFEYYQIDPAQTFGFSGSGLLPMNQGVFQPYPIQQGA